MHEMGLSHFIGAGSNSFDSVSESVGMIQLGNFGNARWAFPSFR